MATIDVQPDAAPDLIDSAAGADTRRARSWPQLQLVYRLSVLWLVVLALVVLYPPIAQWLNRGGSIFGWMALDFLPDVPSTWFFLDDPTERVRDRELLQAGPSWADPMGRDDQARDLLSRTVEGAKISLYVAGIGTAIGIFLGGGLGLVAGYFRGAVDSVVRMIINVTLSIPALLLVIFVTAIRDASLTSVVVAICLLAIPSIARIVRASTLQVADREFVKAAEVIGTRKISILLREVLPNVMPTLISFTFLTTGIILVAESSLSFLGLSVKAPTVTWGSVIANGRRFFSESPHMVFMPSLALFLTVLALNLVGDHLLKRYDIREASI